MAVIKWEYGKWSSALGYICSQCNTVCPYAEGGLAHEDAIDRNGGICPDAEVATTDKEPRHADG